MSQELLKEITESYFRDNIPDMNCGDTVVVRVRIKEGGKERVQAYEGTVLAKHGSGIGKTITVRRVFQGIGVERTFLLHSPRIEEFVVKRRGDVRRAKLYYLRDRRGKAARIKEKQQARPQK
jgi:large subunit ribosomal protein L19